MIFVFGSNESGIHGAGAARYAFERKGARMQQGFGMSGESFAIPTKNWNICALNIKHVKHYVDRFINYTSFHSELEFQVTAIGCGLAGFRHFEIAPLFKNAPDNCYFDSLWQIHLPYKKFWGTF